MRECERRVYVITHPDVVMDPRAPVPRWPLSERGLERMRALLGAEWINDVTAVYSSTEQKSLDGAALLAAHLDLEARALAELGENDRSATGFLPSEEFEETANAFFARPDESICGWETARAAQERMLAAVRGLSAADPSGGHIAIVSHGGVSTLLLCELSGWEIARERDQPGGNGGNYFAFLRHSEELLHGWQPIDPEA
ncbi:MAG: histidine phosphatase family protein [bacterium]|nr:histidine phosphatase family protein [bacterium]